jgi:hypothetical protein
MSVASQIKTPGQVKGPGSGAGASFSGTSGQITLGDGTAADNVPAGAFDNLSAAEITAALATLTATAGQVLRFTGGPGLAVAGLGIGDITGLTAALAGKSDTGHGHAASDITSGTIATARLGSGTANGTTFLAGDQTYKTVSATDATKMALTGGVFTGYPIQKIAEVSVANGSWVNLATGVLSGLLAARFTVLLGGGYGTRSFYWDGSTLTALPDFSNSAIVSGTPATYGFGLQVSGSNIQGYCGGGYGTVAASLSHFSAR